MDKAKRRAVIAGNWKMNKTPKETEELAAAVAAVQAGECDVVICPPFPCLASALQAVQGSRVQVGAQNVHYEKSGAFTGEISCDMLCALGVSHVIVGHSERRQYFAETDDTVNRRARAAVDAGLCAIVCVGETLGQRNQGITEELVRLQTKIALQGLGREELRRVILAYEPVWAIGTGQTATAEQAEEVCGVIRRQLSELFGPEPAAGVSILYGGSMNAKNAAELLAKPNVDGGLIGGAALKAEDFASIIAAADAG